MPHPRPVQPLWQQVELPFAKRIAPSACRSIAPSRFCIRPNRSRVRQRPCCGNNRVKRSELFIEISITSPDNRGTTLEERWTALPYAIDTARRSRVPTISTRTGDVDRRRHLVMVVASLARRPRRIADIHAALPAPRRCRLQRSHPRRTRGDDTSRREIRSVKHSIKSG